jgi:ligand-binding SRPBCC domain-containing protein
VAHDDGFTFTFETALAASAGEVWEHATSLEGVNRELAPLARMAAPPGMRIPRANEFVPGKVLLRSWIYVLGFLPVDYDDVTLCEIEDGRRFLERSPMLTQKLWEHERTIEPTATGCILRDRIRFEPRVRAAARLQLAVYRMVFANRHRNLARMFGRG